MLEEEQNTLLQALLACPRVTKSPWAFGPRAFGHPCASPQRPQQSVLFLKHNRKYKSDKNS